MPTFKPPFTSFRYLKARLNVLKRPMVWVAASGLMLSVFFVGEYLANPQQYAIDNDLDAAISPPNQNPLGNLPAQNIPASDSELFETLSDLSTVPSQTPSTPQSPESGNSRSPLLQEFLLGQSSVAAQKDKPARLQSSLFSTSPSSENRRDRSSEGRSPGLYSGNSTSIKPSSVAPSTAANSSTPTSSGSPALNPLQSALDRYSSIENPSPISPARPLAQSSTEQNSEDSELLTTEDPIRQDFRRQPDLSLQRLPSPQLVPQLSPSPGTTGYTLPPSLRTLAPSVNSSTTTTNLQPLPGQIAPQTPLAVPGQVYDYGQPSYSAGQTSYPRVQPSSASPSPVAAPFSVPRAAPGRSIGGGQINTFSNP